MHTGDGVASHPGNGQDEHQRAVTKGHGAGREGAVAVNITLSVNGEERSADVERRNLFESVTTYPPYGARSE